MHLQPHKQQLPQILRPRRPGAQLQQAPHHGRGSLRQHDDIADVEVRLRRQRPSDSGSAATDVRGGEPGAGGEARADGPAARRARRGRAGVRLTVQVDERARVGRVGADDVVVLVDKGEAEADARAVGASSGEGGGDWDRGGWWPGVCYEREGCWSG
jgi:hypothetical protein